MRQAGSTVKVRGGRTPLLFQRVLRFVVNWFEAKSWHASRQKRSSAATLGFQDSVLGYESLVVFWCVHPSASVTDYTDTDGPAVPNRPELFEFLQLFERMRRKGGECQ